MNYVIKNILDYIKVYIACFMVYTLIFISLFHTPLFSSTVLFYREIFFSIIAFTCTIILFFVIKTSLKLETWISAAIAAACIHFCFFVVVPVTIDRSVTTFLLAYMSESQRPLTKEELTKVFIEQYVTRQDAIGRRMHEQIVSKNVTAINSNATENYQITDQGVRFIQFAKFIRTVYATSDTVFQTHNQEAQKP